MKCILILIFIPFVAKSQDINSINYYLTNIKVKLCVTDSGIIHGKENAEAAQVYLFTMNKTFNTHVFTQGKIDTAYYIQTNTRNEVFKLGLLSIFFDNKENCLKANKLLKKKKHEDIWDNYLLLSYHAISKNHLVFIYSPIVDNEKIKAFFKSLSE